MQDLAPAARQRRADIAARHGVGTEAMAVLPRPFAAHGGTMAQSSHPDLGGMGRWAPGGMVMVGGVFGLALRQGGRVRLHDTGSHRLLGISRQQAPRADAALLRRPGRCVAGGSAAARCSGTGYGACRAAAGHAGTRCARGRS